MPPMAKSDTSTVRQVVAEVLGWLRSVAGVRACFIASKADWSWSDHWNFSHLAWDMLCSGPMSAAAWGMNL